MTEIKNDGMEIEVEGKEENNEPLVGTSSTEQPPLSDEEVLVNLKGEGFLRKREEERRENEKKQEQYLMRSLSKDLFNDSDDNNKQENEPKDILDIRLTHSENNSTISGPSSTDSDNKLKAIVTPAPKESWTTKFSYAFSHPRETVRVAGKAAVASLGRGERLQGIISHERSGMEFQGKLIDVKSLKAVRKQKLDKIFQSLDEAANKELDPETTKMLERFNIEFTESSRRRDPSSNEADPIAIDETELGPISKKDILMFKEKGTNRIHQIDVSKIDGFSELDRKDLKTTYTIKLPESEEFRLAVRGHNILNLQQYTERYAKENQDAYKKDPTTVMISGKVAHVGKKENRTAYIEVPSEPGENTKKTFLKLKSEEYGTQELEKGSAVSFAIAGLQPVTLKESAGMKGTLRGLFKK